MLNRKKAKQLNWIITNMYDFLDKNLFLILSDESIKHNLLLKYYFDKLFKNSMSFQISLFWYFESFIFEGSVIKVKFREEALNSIQ